MEREGVYHRFIPGMNKTVQEIPTVEINLDDSNQPEDKPSNIFDKPWKTCERWNLPSFLQDNIYVLKGYRPQIPSFQKCFLSIFRIHTETVNIWTHLLGCVFCIVLLLKTAQSSLPLQDRLVVSTFLASAVLCLGFSTVFHTVQCYSPAMYLLFNHLDYCGINLLITGNFVTWFYYIFFCDATTRNLYLTGSVVLGVCATIVSLSRTFSRPCNRKWRVKVFVAFALSGAVPTAHYILEDGWNAFLMVSPFLLTAILYFVGALIYAVRIPEKIFPGKCDILFQSHQWLHVMCLLATATSYMGIGRLTSFVQLGRNNPGFCQRDQFYYELLHNYASDMFKL